MEQAQPEQTFFEDEALDRAFGVVMALASEVYVLRDRVQALEALLSADQFEAYWDREGW